MKRDRVDQRTLRLLWAMWLMTAIAIVLYLWSISTLMGAQPMGDPISRYRWEAFVRRVELAVLLDFMSCTIALYLTFFGVRRFRLQAWLKLAWPVALLLGSVIQCYGNAQPDTTAPAAGTALTGRVSEQMLGPPDPEVRQSLGHPSVPPESRGTGRRP
jgi:hypothetical protein